MLVPVILNPTKKTGLVEANFIIPRHPIMAWTTLSQSHKTREKSTQQTQKVPKQGNAVYNNFYRLPETRICDSMLHIRQSNQLKSVRRR